MDLDHLTPAANTIFEQSAKAKWSVQYFYRFELTGLLLTANTKHICKKVYYVSHSYYLCRTEHFIFTSTTFQTNVSISHVDQINSVDFHQPYVTQ